MQAQLCSSDILRGIVPTRTTADVTIYIATTGSDELGRGTLSSPYATWDKAFAQVPLFIEHRVRIKARAGTYTSFPRQVRHFIGRMGILSLEGMDAPTVLAGPFAVDTATVVGYDQRSGWDLTVSGVTWTADQ